MSAPHMYVTVLEALELHSGLSFLNVGSGSGYLSCLVAYLVGESGLLHGIEIHDEVVHHSRSCSLLWLQKMQQNGLLQKIDSNYFQFLSGNCFQLNLDQSQFMKYDRIYVGAGCPESKKEFFYNFLNENGILVLPINERSQMLKIRRLAGNVFQVQPISNVHFAPLIETVVIPPPLPQLAATRRRSNSNRSTSSSDDDPLQLQERIAVQTIQHADPQTLHIVSLYQPRPTITNVATITTRRSPRNSTNNTNHNTATPSNATTNTTGANQVPQGILLPTLVWQPIHERHLQFPPAFRAAVKQILLAANRVTIRSSSVGHSSVSSSSNGNANSTGSSNTTNYSKVMNSNLSGILPMRKTSHNLFALLPLPVWFHILSYMHRDWFIPNRSELSKLKVELTAERRLRKSFEQKIKETEQARRNAERERDLFRVC
jgi:protein-L-isoaspartate O-methyltransferase